MSDNVNRYLDGEIPRSGVPLPEQEALRETDQAIAAARSWVREQDVPDLASRVMAALAEGAIEADNTSVGAAATFAEGAIDRERGVEAHREPAPTAPSSPRKPAMAKVLEGIRWIWTPRPISIRPAMVGAFALLAFVALTRPGQTPVPTSPTTAGVSAQAPTKAPVYIQFRLDTPNASNVALAGTFTEWEPAYSLYESAPGVWTVTVPLEPGVHDYLFIVDGERWVPDPAAPPVDDGFGGTNSRLLLSAPQREA